MGLARIILALLLCLNLTDALIEWDFNSNGGFLLGLKFSIGTPEQLGHVFMVNDPNTPALVVPSVLNDQGFYNPKFIYFKSVVYINSLSASKTFVRTGTYTDKYGNVNGQLGEDIFSIGNSATIVENQPFAVIDEKWNLSSFGLLGLARLTTGQSFIQSILSAYPEQVLVITYDRIESTNKNGTLTLGGRPKTRCADDWAFALEAKYDDDPNVKWAMKVDSLKFGKYTFKQSRQALISIEDPNFSIPSTIYDQLMIALGSTAPGFISCNSTLLIEFKMSDILLTLGPDVYVGEKQKNGMCIFNGSKNESDKEGFVIPVTVLKNKCYLLDYKNERIEISRRI